jgi:HK97 gp10 family phage protein
MPSRVKTTLVSRIGTIRAQARVRAGNVVAKTAHDIETHAKDNVPVDTGAAKNSIHVEDAGELRRRVVVGVDYGEPLEYGTYKMAARPFMTPAAVANAGPFEHAMKQIVDG